MRPDARTHFSTKKKTRGPTRHTRKKRLGRQRVNPLTTMRFLHILHMELLMHFISSMILYFLMTIDLFSAEKP